MGCKGPFDEDVSQILMHVMTMVIDLLLQHSYRPFPREHSCHRQHFGAVKVEGDR